MTALPFAALLASVGLAAASPQPADPRDAYLALAKQDAVRFAGLEARVSEAVGAELDTGGYIVCGTLDAGAEQLPFATLWSAGDKAADGATLVGQPEAMRRHHRHGDAYHKSIRLTCRDAGLTAALPADLETP